MVAADMEALAKAFRGLLYNAYSATLVGNPARVTSRFYERTQELTPGALVAEISTVWQIERAIDAVGYLERITSEPIDFGPDAEPWDEEAEGRPHPLEKVTYIRTLDGRSFRWTNASFISAPTELVSSFG